MQVFGTVPSNNSAEMSALNPEPVRPGSKLSQRINNMLRVLRAQKEVAQVGDRRWPWRPHVLQHFPPLPLQWACAS